jgi:hypothetical protein
MGLRRKSKVEPGTRPQHVQERLFVTLGTEAISIVSMRADNSSASATCKKIRALYHEAAKATQA